METTGVKLSAELQAAAEDLAHNLEASRPIIEYQAAQKNLDADPNANSLLEQLAAVQANLRARQARGAVNTAEVARLRSLQAEVQANATIMAYALAQQNAVSLLREVNQEINQLLGLDFAALTRKGCC